MTFNIAQFLTDVVGIIFWFFIIFFYALGFYSLVRGLEKQRDEITQEIDKELDKFFTQGDKNV